MIIAWTRTTIERRISTPVTSKNVQSADKKGPVSDQSGRDWPKSFFVSSYWSKSFLSGTDSSTNDACPRTFPYPVTCPRSSPYPVSRCPSTVLAAWRGSSRCLQRASIQLSRMQQRRPTVLLEHMERMPPKRERASRRRATPQGPGSQQRRVLRRAVMALHAFGVTQGAEQGGMPGREQRRGARNNLPFRLSAEASAERCAASASPPPHCIPSATKFRTAVLNLSVG